MGPLWSRLLGLWWLVLVLTGRTECGKMGDGC